MRAITIAAAAMLAMAGAAHGQMPDGSASRAAMQRLSFMTGTWRGEAWMERGGQREQTTMTETVEWALDGVALLVKGRGVIPAAGGQSERIVHDALGVLYFDAASGGYLLRSWINTGQTGEFVVTPLDSGVSWMREVPGGRIRNTARFTNNEWHEVGEFSRDGITWRQIMEMRLRRAG